MEFSRTGIVYIVEIIAEVDGVHRRAQARRPAKGYIRVHKHGAVSRAASMGASGRNREAPDITLPRTVGICRVDLVDSPIVGRLRNKAVRIGESRQAGNEEGESLVTPE